MENKKAQAVYLDAIETWGEQPQLQLAIEECAELIKAIVKWQRAALVAQTTINSLDVPDALLDEMVDVEVMLEQLKLIVHAHNTDALDRFDARKQFKIDRLQQRILDWKKTHS